MNFSEILAGAVVSAAISVMILCFMTTMADVASKPAVHSAPYAVRNNPNLLFQTDQSRATPVSLSGPDSGPLYVEVSR